jgi:hypothetical protein
MKITGIKLFFVVSSKSIEAILFFYYPAPACDRLCLYRMEIEGSGASYRHKFLTFYIDCDIINIENKEKGGKDGDWMRIILS